MKNTENIPIEIEWPELISGKLVRRYKRFLADVVLDNGKKVTAHCPNSGSMAACSEPGRRVYLSYHDNPKRKLKYTWELIQMPGSLVGTNTLVPNRLVYNAVLNDRIAALKGYDAAVREVPMGNHTRLDLMLTGQEKTCLIEIKNCTLVKERVAMFPDAVTARGLKHVRELESRLSENVRSVMFFLVQRMDADSFRPAVHIDPTYADALKKAHAAGVEILVYDVFVDLAHIRINRNLPFEL